MMLNQGSLGMSVGLESRQRIRLGLVGTGIRGIRFWGRYVLENYGDIVGFVCLCDINPGRLEFARQYLGLNDCPTYTNFDQMLDEANIDLLMVTTVDNTHDEFIVKALNRDINVLTEKPMTTTAQKCQNIVNAARQSKARLIMGFNYRYGSLFTKLKELLLADTVGKITSVDFHWYLNTHHGASYFRRWHGIREKSGTLLLHKASHHFDLLNWFIGSDPVEVHAFGGLEHYGKNNAFRGKRCMDCPHTAQCKFYWDMTKDKFMMDLYHANEKYDGYIRDNCLWREEIDIYDKMAVQIRYANDVQVSYSLTAYSPYEGFRLAFNGMNGRMETWEGVPSLQSVQIDQSEVYEKGMGIAADNRDLLEYHEIVTQLNFEEHQTIKHPFVRELHWGGDKVMADEIFRSKGPDPAMHHAADYRDGSMAVLIGIAARKSIDEGRAIRINGLTDLNPQVNKWG